LRESEFMALGLRESEFMALGLRESKFMAPTKLKKLVSDPKLV